MQKLFDITTRLLTQAIKGTQRRHQVLGNNIANADTPDFQAMDYPFEEHLRRMLYDEAPERREMQPLESYDLEREYRMMMPRVSLAHDVEPDLIAQPPVHARLDGNSVNIDREMAELTQNSIQHKSFVNLLNAKVRMLRTALKG